jgi:hypothetical protein
MPAKKRQKRQAAEQPAPAQPASPDAEADSPEQAQLRTRRGLRFLILFAAVMVLVIVGGVIYLRWNAARVAAEYRYNGFDFSPVHQGSLTLWLTQIQSKGKAYSIPFYTHPRDAESVVLQQGVTDWLVRPELRPDVLYLTFPVNAGSSVVIAGVEISRITGFRYDLLNIETHGALQQPAGNETNTAVITCANATRSVGVLSFEAGKNDIIYRDTGNPYCLHIQYVNASESIRVADRFAYGLLRIMPG